jgi:cobaltochelatase CobT
LEWLHGKEAYMSAAPLSITAPITTKAWEATLGATMRALASGHAPLTLTLQGMHAPDPLTAQTHWFIPNASTDAVRGVSDRLALVKKHHNASIHQHYCPTDAASRQVFEALEVLRVEWVGTHALAGVQHNLHEQWAAQCAEAYHADTPLTPALLGDILRAMLLHDHDNLSLPPPAVIALHMERIANAIDRATQGQWRNLLTHAPTQTAYAHACITLISQLSSVEGSGLPVQATQENSEESGTEDAQTTHETPVEAEQVFSPTPSDTSASTIHSEIISSLADMAAIIAGEEVETTAMAEAPPAELPVPAPPSAQQPYHPFTTQFDEVVAAEKLASTEELQRLRAELDQKLQQVQGSFTRLSARLQRLLLAKQQMRWTFEEEEGMLDAGRLARLVVNPAWRHSFKQRHDCELTDTIITLLIDNSGSMRGRPITIAALSSDILARVLERAGIKVEILGFTTREWKGGQSAKAWQAAGRPARAGRLNDLRHIIYKSADTPFVRARRALALMLKEGLLKENIDGEALLWAYRRLQHRPEKRRILMVISDGAPVDDATLSANATGYLDQHLCHVIATIEADPNTELTAIGIGHDVTRYYKRSLTLPDVTRLGETMTTELVRLFS